LFSVSSRVIYFQQYSYLFSWEQRKILPCCTQSS
jgi:hypothetical protein